MESTAGAGGPPENPSEPASPALLVGRAVRLNGSVPYLKTADPMPMLRPPDLVDPGEAGVVVECRALGILAVRFRRGTFLLEQGCLSPLAPEASGPC